MKQVNLNQIFLVRHGESDGNQQHIYQGQGDCYHLTKTGQTQAIMAAEALWPYQPGLLVTSPLKRAKETTRIIQEQLNGEITIIEDPLLQEVNLGFIEGLTKAECAERYPEEMKQLSLSDFDFSIFGGESLKDVQRRVALIEQKYLSTASDPMVLITHGALLKTLLVRRGFDNIRKQVGNGSVLLVETVDNIPEIKKLA